MKEARRIATLALFPVLLAAERLAYWAVRSLLSLFLGAPAARGGLALGFPAIEALSRRTAALNLWLPLAGGALALALGARVTYAAGAALAVVGFAALGHASAGSIAAILVVIAVAQGLLKPSLYAALGERLRAEPDNVREAVFVGLFLAVNLGGFLGPQAGAAMRGTDGYLLPFTILAGVMVAVGLVAFAALAPPPRDAGSAAPARSWLGAAALLGAAIPFWIGSALVGRLQFLGLLQAASAAQIYVLAGFSAPALVIFGLVLASVARARIPALLPAGLGLIVFAAGAILALGDSSTAALASVVFTVLAETLITPFLLARLVRSLPPRPATLAVAAWLVVQAGLPRLFEAPGAPGHAAVIAAAITCALLGGLLVMFHEPIAKRAFEVS